MYFNAHCHLELSFLKGRITPGLPFTEWLERMMLLRHGFTEQDRIAAIHLALARMEQTGTEAVLDILSRDDIAEQPWRDTPPIRAILFREMIAFTRAEGPPAVTRAFERQSTIGPLPAHLRHGLSPHAPYTTTGPLLRAASSMASLRKHWLCIHAAETPEETELCLTGGGPLREFLEPSMPLDWSPPAMRPIPWLDIHDSLGPRTLLVHCNDIDETDLRIIRARGCSVVVCPGSHIYFGRGAFPLERLLAAGIPVYLGTDSLASNEDLDMGREIALAKELAPGVPAQTIERLADISRAETFFGGSPP